jgi:hypothetical protein
MSSDEVFELIRDWVRSEIDYAIALREEGEDGHTVSAVTEKKYADKMFGNLRSVLLMLFCKAKL